MDNFRSTLKKRLAAAGLYNAAFILMLVLGPMLGRRFALSDLALGFASGFLVGIQLVMIFYMGKYLAAVRNEDKLKSLYIEEHDERKKHILLCAGRTGVPIIIGGTAFGMVVSCFISQTVFFTLLSVLAFSLLVFMLLKLYYSRKV